MFFGNPHSFSLVKVFRPFDALPGRPCASDSRRSFGALASTALVTHQAELRQTEGPRSSALIVSHVARWLSSTQSTHAQNSARNFRRISTYDLLDLKPSRINTYEKRDMSHLLSKLCRCSAACCARPRDSLRQQERSSANQKQQNVHLRIVGTKVIVMNTCRKIGEGWGLREAEKSKPARAPSYTLRDGDSVTKDGSPA